MQSQTLNNWTLSDPILKKWLQARQELLAAFHRLCLLRPFNFIEAYADIACALQEFCQLLVDYISLLHFVALEHIVAQVESHAGRSNVSLHLIEKIWQTSSDALNFQEKYQVVENLCPLDTDLSFLSEQLARRMELEDNLLAIYYQAVSGANISVPPESHPLYAKSA